MSAVTAESPVSPNYDLVVRASEKLDAWIEAQQFRGWDPHDGLNSPILRRLTFGNRLLGIGWLQLVKRSPLNVRPLLLVPKGRNPKAMGLFLASYLRKYLMCRSDRDLTRTRFFLDWLETNTSAGAHGAAWAYNFDWPNRDFYAPAGTPTIVNTSFIALACLDLATLPDANTNLSGLRELGTRGAALARSACDFVLQDLGRQDISADEFCFSYTPIDMRRVHNANVLGAWMLAEVASRTLENTLRDAALSSARYTARRQRPDSTWPYGEGSRDGWVDNFHTAYVLVALRRIGLVLATSEFDHAVSTGYGRWLEMFEPTGAPRYYEGQLYPIDAHCVATAILTFLEFGDLARAETTANWAVTNMQDRRGFFHYQIHKHHRIRIPYMRWCQAWMQRALTELMMRRANG